MSGRSSARKGANGEREVVTILRERGYHVERGGTQSYGQRPDLYGLEGIHLEVKRCETARIWDWMQQSRQDAARFGDGLPTVIFRRSRSDWLICMELTDWLTMYERAQSCKCGGHCSISENQNNQKRRIIMLYTKNESGEMTPITYGNTYAKCPACGVFHQVDLSEMMECAGGDVEDVSAYCSECTKRHMPLLERMDEVEFVASRFPGTDVKVVGGIVRSGLDRGFSFDTALVGAKLALAMQTGQAQLFTLDEVASAMGCSREAAEAEMENLGISPIKASTLPGFEWALGET